MIRSTLIIIFYSLHTIVFGQNNDSGDTLADLINQSYEVRDTVAKGKLCMKIGAFLQEAGAGASARDYYLKAKTLFMARQETDLASEAVRGVLNIYSEGLKYWEYLDVIESNKEILVENDFDLSWFYYRKGFAYMNLRIADSAEYYYKKCMGINNSDPESVEKASFHMLGVYSLQGQHEKVLKGLEGVERPNSKWFDYMKKSIRYRLFPSKQLLKELEIMGDTLANTALSLNDLDNLIVSDTIAERYESAARFLMKFDSLKDKQNLEDLRAFQLAEEVNYKLIKRLEEIESLREKNDILGKLQARNNFVFILLTLLVISVTIILIIIYKNLNIHKKELREIKKLNKIISEKSEELQVSNEELEKTVQKLKLTQNTLIENEKMTSLGILVSGVAHEINNPLNFIKGGSHMLRQSDTEEEDKQSALQLINDGILRIQRITRKLAELNDNSEDGEEQVPVAEILEQAISLIEGENIAIKRDYNTQNSIAYSNTEKLRQTFYNILINGVQAYPANEVPWLRISIQDEFNKLTISFEDKGQGMTVEEKTKAVSPFFTTKDPNVGVGLGLSLVHYVINGMGGVVTIDSEKGVGTKVTLQLPVIINSEN